MISDYVVFDLHALYEMANTIRSNIGSIFSVALYCFIGVLGIYLVIHLISDIAR